RHWGKRRRASWFSPASSRAASSLAANEDHPHHARQIGPNLCFWERGPLPPYTAITRVLLTTSSLSFLFQRRDELLAELRPMAKLALSLLSLSVLFLTGCFTIGPRTVARDRFDYSTAISESWKRQTLLNLIKIRYADAPVFLDVTSI